MWAAILVTVVASGANNIGKALQKQATKTLPRLTLTRDVVLQYLACPMWLVGLAADVAGGVLMVQAFALAPVSVVQPVSAVGLVALMLFSHFFLHERLQPHEWLAAGAAGVGIIALGASSESGPQQQEQQQQVQEPAAALLAATAATTLNGDGMLASGESMPPLPAAVVQAAAAAGPSVAHVAAGFLLLLAVLAAELAWRHRLARRSGKGGSGSSAAPTDGNSGHHGTASAAADAALCGLEAGACFGLSAASCRTGFQLAPQLGWLTVPAGIAASIALTSGGFVLQTRGLKSGNTVVVCTLATASSMVSGVLAGMLALGEQLPSSRGHQALRLLGWALILWGVASLAGGPVGGRNALTQQLLAAAAADVTPPWLHRRLPRRLRKALLRAAEGQAGGGEGGSELPLTANIHAQ